MIHTHQPADKDALVQNNSSKTTHSICSKGTKLLHNTAALAAQQPGSMEKRRRNLTRLRKLSNSLHRLQQRPATYQRWWEELRGERASTPESSLLI
ncbi:uncharacterized protein G2W53_031397 [Senna tora]|uniref:Uncharacterized protein n=1 Tax=Senna tora TaxID=362788 RepID=A0A834WDX6_9FABA|nr:uncharacterized protein G2W53_031397 [Senna tora]